MEKPTLIDPIEKIEVNKILTNSLLFKKMINNYIINFLVFILVVGGISLFLYYKYTTKPTSSDIQEKDNIKKDYIVNKIKEFNDIKLKKSQNLITGLPYF